MLQNNGDNGRMEEEKEAQERSVTEWSTLPTASIDATTSGTVGESSVDPVAVHTLVAELCMLRLQVEAQAQQLQQIKDIGDSTDNEDAWSLPPPPPPLLSNISPFPQGHAHAGFHKDLYRLAKMVKCIIFEPRDEKEYKDILDEWEAKARGCGMHSVVVKNLLVYVGALKVRQAAAEMPVASLQWLEVKNRVARVLFPFSRYRRDLEREIEEENRSLQVDDTVVLLAKYRKRHADLCVRWHQSNTLSNDRMKDALLVKLPADKVTPCLSVKGYHTFSYEEFAYHCKMVAAALEAGSKATKRPTTRTSIRTSSTPIVHALQVGAVGDTAVTATPKKPAPPDYVCFNCGERGHFAKACPHPKVKCANCGRLGHKASSCTKLQHDGPLGRTRTGFLRMTREGIHLDLIDEATKRALFDSMRKHLETQEQTFEKAKQKAKERRDEKRAQAQLQELEATPMEVSELMVEEPPEKLQKVHNVAHAAFIEIEEKPGSQFVDLEIFGSKYPVLLDSGAVISLLPTKIWECLPPEQKENVASCDPGAQPLIGLGGAFDVDTIIDLPIMVGRKALVQRFFVSSAPQTPILGIDALTNLEIQMNFANQEVFFAGAQEPVELVEPLGISKLCIAAESQPMGVGPDLQMGPGATEQEKKEVTLLFQEYESIWKDPIFGQCTSTLHHIDTGTATPIRNRLRRLPPEKIKEVKAQIDTLLEKGAIRRSNSPWASAIVLVPKANGTTRLCVDYRSLNEVTVKDAFPLPRITDLLDRLSGAKIFSTLDLAAGFHQIPLDKESIPKTAFITPEGLYQFIVLPFGLANAPSTFQRMTDALFREPPLSNYVSVYIDDIVVFTTTAEHHLVVLRQVLNKLKETRLFVNLQKTVLFARKAKYLGFIVQDGIITPDPKQIDALSNLQVPKDASAVRRFLGLTGYFRHFIENFLEKVLPLTNLLKKNTPFVWASAAHSAWTRLKDELAQPHLRLVLPIPGRIFTLDTDASDFALGAVLLQEDDTKHLRPIAYASRTLTAAERNWTTREQEAFAVVWGILHFSSYLRTQPHFIVRTDHQSLRWLWNTDNKRIIRWALLLREYNFTIQHNKGSAHQHVDIFSRDVASFKESDLLVERVAVPLAVFQADLEIQATPILNRFPSFDDLLDAQKQECTPELVKSYKLREGSQGLWETLGGQVYVPESLRDAIKYYFHYGKAGAHQGVNRAFSRIRKHFYWPGLKESLQAYHSHYLTCMRRRPKPPVGSRGHLLAAHIGGVVALDVVGPLKLRGEQMHFLTVIDHMTRYPHAICLFQVSSTSVWRGIYNEWIAYFGVPAYFLTDNASVFKSAEFTSEVTRVGGQILHSFPYHPEGNGIVESFHLYFKRALVSSLRLSSDPISTILSDILSAYQSTPHPTTGESLFFLLTGMDMLTPNMHDWAVDYSEDYEKDRTTLIQQLRDLAFDDTARRAVLREQSKKSMTDLSDLLPGTLVLYWLHPPERNRFLVTTTSTTKTKPLWSGPCRIIRKATTRDNTYVLRSLWRKEKPKIIPREELLVIKGAWTYEEAQRALKELMADLQLLECRYQGSPTI